MSDSRPATTALLLLPGALTVYLSFNAGGFFPNTVAFVTLLVAGALILRIGAAEAPFEGISRGVLLAAGALALYAGWTLLSALWSDSAARALIEFDRALLYLLVLLLFGSLGRSPFNLQWLVRGMAAAIVIVATIALITRVLPETWPIGADLASNRLSYPLTYWNALGLLAGLGIVFCAYLTTSLQEPPIVRVLSAAPIPALAATLLFTFSRGAIGATVIGLIAYMVVARPRGLVTGILAVAPPTAFALVSAYDADLLATTSPTTPAAIDQGHEVAVAIAVCTAVAAGVRTLMLLADHRLATLRLPRIPRPALAAGAAVAVVAALAIALAADVPDRIDRQYDNFVHGTGVGSDQGDFRTRLTDPGNNGRIDQWDVAIEAFERNKLDGSGAGTYILDWAQNRPTESFVTDTHSLYAEVLGELGVVGFLLLMTALGTIVVAIALRAKGRYRSVYAGLFAAALTWAVHAGIDWDWEMPAVTLWLFAAGGAVLARSEGAPAYRWSTQPVRIGAAVGLAAIAVVPMLIFISQSRLNESLRQFAVADCPAAISSAESSTSALGLRPEPYEVIAYCELLLGHPDPAVVAMRKALDRDPYNWSYHQGLAIALAAAGSDPRAEAREALRLNPRDPSTIDSARRFSSANRATWKQRAQVLVEVAFD